MKTRQSLIALLLPLALAFGAATAAEPSASQGMVEHGRYLVRTSGCNDCHTPGYAEKGGKIPERDWLTGNPVGFQGPWGTTYPVNLRLLVQSLTEPQWTRLVRGAARPPMPWVSLSSMTDRDLRSIYRFVRSLGAAGNPAPAFVPPGKTVTTPYIEFFPKNLPKQAPTH